MLIVCPNLTPVEAAEITSDAKPFIVPQPRKVLARAETVR